MNDIVKTVGHEWHKQREACAQQWAKTDVVGGVVDEDDERIVFCKKYFFI